MKLLTESNDHDSPACSYLLLALQKQALLLAKTAKMFQEA